MTDETLPAYKDLPVTPGAPPNSAWGLWGKDDQLGAFNLQTPERIAAAAQLVRRGRMFPLSWKMELPDPAFGGRGNLRHTLWSHRDGGADDCYDNYYPQSSTQWDALCHAGKPGAGFYNGVQFDDVVGPEKKNGIHVVARRGIAGRAVLVDFGRWAEKTGREFDYEVQSDITVEDVEAVLKDQGASIGTGDILLLRTGWMAFYEKQSPEWRQRAARRRAVPGLKSGREMVAYLWDLHVSAVCADNYAVESFSDMSFTLHDNLMGLCGVTLAEYFFLEDLARDCAEQGTYDSFFVAAPLNKLGGAGSPGNAIAFR
jgi:kynurenine formamidase